MGVTIFGILVLLLLGGFIVGGIILVITSRRGGFGYPACGACHYNLSGTIGSGTRCPECGADIADAGIIPSRGRRSPARMWIGIAMIAVPLTCFGALLFAGVRQTGQIQTANSRANAAATANAQRDSDALTTNDNAASSPNQPITPDER